MTKKNAKKVEARAQQEKRGGKYQHHLREGGGAGGGREGGSSDVTKYVHVEYGTQEGTVWLLSDEPKGSALGILVPEGPLTPDVAQEAFGRAVYPLINETSDDGGVTWVQHLDVEPRRDWVLARRLIYSLLGSGYGGWNAARIRARTGEDLVRHPPKIIQDVASHIRVAVTGAQLTLRPPNDQLFVRVGTRMFALATSMKRSAWPIYVTPIPPPSQNTGSWECFTIEDVLSTLRWPDVQPIVRIASVDEIREEGSSAHSASGSAVGSAIRVVPKFDLNDPRNKTERLATGAYRDPIRPVEIINGERVVLVWVSPGSQGIAGWRFEITHQHGPWPLQDDERAAFEDWIENFAQMEWPERTQIWPLVYLARSETWARAQPKAVEASPMEELVRHRQPDLEQRPMYELEAKIIVSLLGTRIPGRASAATGPGPTATVRYYVEGTPIVLNTILFNGKIMSQAFSEPGGGIMWGVKENPLNEDGARRAASQMIEWVTARVDAPRTH